jgi:hypothetical protein
MLHSREFAWISIGAEAVAILFSILLAFGIQAWWDARGDSIRETVVLEALRDDFVASRETIEDWLAFHQAVQQSTLALTRESLASTPTLSREKLNLLLLDLSWWDSSQRFNTGALNSLISTGDLALISNDDLRRDLAELPAWMGVVSDLQQQDYDFFASVWLPFLREKGLLLTVANLESHLPGQPAVKTIPMGVDFEQTVDPRSVIADKRFPQLMAHKWWVSTDMVLNYQQSLERLDSLITKIDAELAR